MGIPGSGKSRWIKNQSGYTVISPDDIRAELSDISDQSVNPQAWAMAKKRTEQALKSGKDVILDATNVVSYYRKSFLEGLPEHTLKAKIFEVDPETAKKRIRKDITEGKKRSDVPDDIIDSMYVDFKKTINENELQAEGFHLI